MAEYAEREKRFNNGLGEVMGDFAVAVVEADNAAKDATIDRYVTLLEKGNVDFATSTSLIGIDEPLETRISVPVISIAPVDPIVVDEAEIEMSMTVSAETSQSDSLRSTTESDTEISGGIGIFKVKTRIKANVSVDKEKKRRSDYTATTNARLHMRQGEPPETLSKIMDSITSIAQRGMDIQERLIDAKAQRMLDAAVAAGDELPAIEAGEQVTDVDSVEV